MEIIIRYKNGTLYSKQEQEFITLEDVRRRPVLSYSVLESGSKEDITAEVKFLADVDHVRRKRLWAKAAVVLSAWMKE